jgi:hypothetical protein
MFQKNGKYLRGNRVGQYKDSLLPTKMLLEEASKFCNHPNADPELKRRIARALKAIEEACKRFNH